MIDLLLHRTNGIRLKCCGGSQEIGLANHLQQTPRFYAQVSNFRRQYGLRFNDANAFATKRVPGSPSWDREIGGTKIVSLIRAATAGKQCTTASVVADQVFIILDLAASPCGCSGVIPAHFTQ